MWFPMESGWPKSVSYTHLDVYKRQLLAWADTIEEIKTVCWCGRKATCNARVQDGRVVKEGEQILLGGNEQYVSLCRRHWQRGELSPEEGVHEQDRAD